MLGRKTYSKGYIDGCRAQVAEQVAAFRAVADAAGSGKAAQPVAELEPEGVEPDAYDDELDAYDTFEMYRVICPDCAQPIALLADEEELPEHALCASPWNPFGLTVCAGTGRSAADARPADESFDPTPTLTPSRTTRPNGTTQRPNPSRSQSATPTATSATPSVRPTTRPPAATTTPAAPPTTTPAVPPTTPPVTTPPAEGTGADS